MAAPEVTLKKRPDELVGLVVGGRYQLLHRLASGGMGSVYVGRAVGAGGFERRLAVKLLHPHLAEREKFVAMFLDEARLAARIHHPNVVSTLDVFEWDGRYYLVMEYVEGLELGRLIHEALKKQARFPNRIALRIILDSLYGLAAAHALTDKSGQPLNLVHRDISPQNILVGADGISRLTDFGVAKAEDRLQVTEGNEFKGKVAYASPEQLEHSIVEQRSDVFAMGVVLYEVLTQKRLFKADDKYGIRRMILAGEYPPPSTLDPSLAPFDAILARAMARDLGARTPSAAVLAREVESVAQTVGGLAMPTEVAEWVRELAVEFFRDRAEVIHDAESQVPYPADLGATPQPTPRGSGVPIPAPMLGMPDHSEVVPAGARSSVAEPIAQEPTRVSKHSSHSELTPLSGLEIDLDPEPLREPEPMPIHRVPVQPGARPATETSYVASTTATVEQAAARRQRGTWIFLLVALLVTAAVIGVVVSAMLDDQAPPPPVVVPLTNPNATPPRPSVPTANGTGTGTGAGTVTGAGTAGTGTETPTPTEPIPTADPTEIDTPPEMVFGEEELAPPVETEANGRDEEPSMRRRGGSTGMRSSMTDPPAIEEVENPYRNL